jgi:hypothetical protein
MKTAENTMTLQLFFPNHLQMGLLMVKTREGKRNRTGGNSRLPVGSYLLAEPKIEYLPSNPGCYTLLHSYSLSSESPPSLRFLLLPAGSNWYYPQLIVKSEPPQLAS